MSRSRAIGHAITLINSLYLSGRTNILCGNYTMARAELTEAIALSSEKSALFWNAQATASLGVLSTLVGNHDDAVKMISTGMATWRSTGATASVPFFESYLAMAHAMLGQYHESRHHICQAMATIEATGETLWSAEVDRLAGEIALLLPSPDVAAAQAHFERAISTARQQQAKSWELRASTSLARLWSDQNQREQASELLVSISRRFTEGFETHDVKQATALLKSLSS